MQLQQEAIELINRFLGNFSSYSQKNRSNSFSSHFFSLKFSRQIGYHKILKISPRVYIFQRPFLRGLFLEVLIHGGAYLQREICVLKSIGLAL